MNIANKTALVTGANRGLGRALVEEALRRGAKRVDAGTRQPLTHTDGRVTPLTLDVTNAARAGQSVEEYLQQLGPLLTPEIAGTALVELGQADAAGVAPADLLTGAGLQKLS